MVANERYVLSASLEMFNECEVTLSQYVMTM